jgi:hypothetical protein
MSPNGFFASYKMVKDGEKNAKTAHPSRKSFRLIPLFTLVNLVRHSLWLEAVATSLLLLQGPSYSSTFLYILSVLMVLSTPLSLTFPLGSPLSSILSQSTPPLPQYLPVYVHFVLLPIPPHSSPLPRIFRHPSCRDGESMSHLRRAFCWRGARARLFGLL